KVKLVVPEGINLVSVMPEKNWGYKFEKDDNDNITTVTWTAIDDGIGPNEFTEFYFVASNPGEPGQFSWNAYQTYDDGSVVEWVGDSDADEPASVTNVVEGDAVAQHDGEAPATSKTVAQDESGNDNSSGKTIWLTIFLSAAAILLALISLFRKRT